VRSHHFKRRNDRSWKDRSPVFCRGIVAKMHSSRFCAMRGGRGSFGRRLTSSSLVVRSAPTMMSGLLSAPGTEPKRSDPTYGTDSPNLLLDRDLSFFAVDPGPPLSVACPRFLFPPLSPPSRTLFVRGAVLVRAVLNASLGLCFRDFEAEACLGSCIHGTGALNR